MKRRLLSLFVAFAMTISMVVVGAGAVEPTYGDTAGHWAESAIDRWSGHGIIQGSNGEFDPNGPLTCAQLATILAKLLKLPAATDAGFHDNAAGAWYYDAINRCAAAGILNGNGDGTVDPSGAISRERAMVMLGRALGIQPIEKPDLTKFSDAAKVASYAQGMVAALIEKGIVGGVTSDTLAPQDDINRASTVTILDRAIGSYADKAGETVKVESKGIVLVVAGDVTITGDVEQIIVPADNIEVTIRGCENIDSIIVTGENSKVILDNSSANDVTLDSKNTEIETKGNSKVDTVNVSEDAAGATVNAGSGTSIGSVENKAEDTTVTGNGSVKEVASDKDMTVETKNTEVKNTGDEKISVTDKNGKTTETAAGGSTTTGGTSGSSSGGSSHSHSYNIYETDWSTMTTVKKCSCGATQTIENSNTYYIANDTDLKAFRNKVNAGEAFADKTITLTDDVDLKNEEWTPIGVKDGNKFKGTFDGQGNSIKNMRIENGPNYAAFFGAVENATVKDLTVEGSVSGSNVAGIFGRVDGSSTIVNCINNATVSGTEKAAGIVVKIEANNTTLEGCKNFGNISGATNNGAAGIVVYAQDGTFTIKDCVNEGEVKAPCAGGIVYNVSDKGNGTITGCVNKGSITAERNNVGGIVSVNSVGTKLTISGCTNEGAISGENASAITCSNYKHEDGKPNTNSGTITASSVRYISECEATLESGMENLHLYILPNTNVTINGGTYTGNITNKGTLTVAGGTFTGENFFNEGTLTINNGTFKEVRTNNAGITTINGGTLDGVGTWSKDNQSYTGKLTINGGTIGGHLTLAAGTGNVEVKGGHFTYNDNRQVMISIVDGANGTVTISGGTFDWTTENRFCMANADKLSITGGTFSSDPSAYVAAGFTATENNGIWTVSSVFDGGTGTAEDPFEIASAEQLNKFREMVNAGNTFAGKTIELTADIDLNNTEWTPIGTSTNPFNGVFDGKGKTISNLKITKTGATSETDYYAGLFGCVKGTRTGYVATSNIWNSDTYTLNADSVIAQYTAAIKNLKLENVAVNTDGTIVGALVGMATSAYIYNVDVLSGVVSGTKNFGGVVGRADGCILSKLTTGSSLEVKSCEYRSDIGNYYSLGGIVGTLRADKESTSVYALSAVLNCTNNAAVSAYLTSAAAGGVIGATSSSGASVIYNCVNNGNVTIIGLLGNAAEQRNNSACGIGGQIDGSIGGYGTSVIANCVNNGEIKNVSDKKAGTLAGIANYFSGTYYNCTNNGNISGSACVVSGVAGTGSEVVINQCSNLAAALTGGDCTSTISAVTSKTTYKNMTFATSEELQKALTTGTTSDTITLENVTVTTPGTLIIPVTCTKFTSDNAVCSTLAINANITINMPGSYTLSGTKDKEVTISGNSTVTNGDTNGGKIILTGENATIINPSDKTMNAARFDGTGTYTLDNYGTIASNSNHVVSTQSACTITVNNFGTIKTLQSGCYAMLFYDGCTAIVNQYPNSSICEADGVSGYLLAWAGNRSEENPTGDTKASSVIYNTYDNAGQLTESWQMAANPKYMLVGSVSSQEALTSAINNVPVGEETSIQAG